MCAIVLTVWIAGSIIVNRSEKRDQQRDTRVKLRDRCESEEYRDQKMMEEVRRSAQYDETQN